MAIKHRSAMSLNSAAPKNIWHRRMGHLHVGALKHLEDAVDGIKVVEAPKLEHLCEPCHRAIANRKISRRPAIWETVPFRKLHLDLIQMTETYNDDEWALHILDEATRFNTLATFESKGELQDALITIICLLKTQFNAKIRIIMSDQEPTLGNKWKKFAADEGII